jgi:methyl-accepting chemotaxis protein
MVMHSIRWKFMAFFIGLGLSISLVMYIPYSKYIKTTYRNTLTNVLQTVSTQYPVLADPEYLVTLLTEGSQEYWDISYAINDIAVIFDMAYIYYARHTGETFQYVLSSECTPDLPLEEIISLYEEHEIPQEMTAAYKTGSLQISRTPFTDSFGTFVSAYIPIMHNGAIAGILGADYDMSQIRKYELPSQISLIVSIILSAVLAFFLSMSLIKPIVRLFGVLKAIAAGDLTQSVEAKGKNEIATMTLLLSETQTGIKNLIINIREEADTLSDIGNDLAGNMAQTAAAVDEITANIRNVKGRVLNQSASVTETHETMEQVVANIIKLDGLVENQSSNVSQVSSAIEEMAANINSVTGTLSHNAVNVQTLREASEVGRAGLEEVASNIKEIAHESEGLMEINSLLQNIADQTNLLSMNAAIEAAHAGEAGKGFAVVAGEIRKLAEGSSEQSKTIVEVLKKIKGSIGNISQSTKNVITKFEAIDLSIKVVSDQEEHIRGAMEEQGEGSRQIVDGVSGVDEITRQVKSGSREMLEGSKEVIAESNNLEHATQEITQRINEMASGAEQVNVAVNHVNELCGKTRKGIAALIKGVSRFKVE